MEISSHNAGNDVIVIALRETNLDASNVREFKEAVQAMIDPAATRVVFDLQGVKFIDSSGLGALISCLRQLNARRGDLRLCSLTPTVEALLALMRMNRVFQIFQDRQDAVASFA